MKNGANVQVVVANVDDEPSLVRMASQARVVLDCVGPFRFFGEAVVTVHKEEDETNERWGIV